MKKKLFFILMCLLAIQVQAQNTQLKGVVTDSGGEPLIGASVVAVGSKTGATTDLDGNFTLSLPNGSTQIEVSYLGYKKQRINVAGKNELKVTLEEDGQVLQDVVVTALGVKREKKALGYSVQEVSGESVSLVQVASPLANLAGSVAGLSVSSAGSGPGGSIKLVLRGAKSLTRNNEPLYVIDGIPLSNSSGFGGREGGGFDFGNAANDINPDDVESISVLKGGAAAALYGMRGQNGVIMITTKQGKQGGKLDVSFKSTLTLSDPITYPSLQNEYAQGAAGKLVLSETQSWGPKMEGQEYVNFMNQKANLTTNNENPFREFYQTGTNFANSLSITKGLDKGSFMFSFNNLNSKGIVPEESLKKLNMSTRLNYELSKYVTIESKINLTNQQANNRPNLMNSPDNTMYSLYHIPRSVTLGQLNPYTTLTGYPIIYNKEYDITPQGNIVTRNDNFTFGSSPLVQNPYWTTQLNTNEDSRKRIIAYAKADVNLQKILPSLPLDKLNLMVRGGVDYYVDNRRNQVYDRTFFKPDGTATLAVLKGESMEANYDFLLSGFKKTGNIGISASLGGNIQRVDKRTLQSASETGIINKQGPYVIQNFKSAAIAESISQKEVHSLYGMATFDYKSMLYLDMSIRNDWTSALDPSNWSFTYPSVSLSWVASESFEMPQPISFLKFRTSWAEVGNDYDPHQLDYIFAVNPGQYFGLPYAGIPNTKPNRYILPEKTRSFEVGLESRLFDQRLSFDLSYYNTGTRNQIIVAPLAPSSGFGKGVVNAGYIANKGLELSLRGDVVRTKDLTVGLVFNASRNYAKVEEMPEGTDQLGVWGFGGVTSLARQNYAPNLLIGTAYLRDDAGNIMLDKDNLPMWKTNGGAPNTQEILGNAIPKWIGGLGANFSYKGFIGEVFFDGKFGHQMYSYSNMYGSLIGVLDNTIAGRDEWQMAKDLATKTGLEAQDISGRRVKGNKNGVVGEYFANPQAYFERLSKINEAYIYDASFVRLQRISLGYRFTQGFVRNLGAKALSLSLVAQNLLYISKHTPNTTPNSSTTNTYGETGIEVFAYPELRNIGFSVGLDF